MSLAKVTGACSGDGPLSELDEVVLLLYRSSSPSLSARVPARRIVSRGAARKEKGAMVEAVMTKRDQGGPNEY